MFKINSLEDLENISKRMKWQYFEKLVAFIFEKNDFSVKQNVVLKFGKKKRQFDVIAERFNNVFLVECKKWSKFSEASVKKAVKDHKERCILYSEGLKNKHALPIIVTLLEGDIKLHDSMPIIPIDKLNLFINSFEEIELESA